MFILFKFSLSLGYSGRVSEYSFESEYSDLRYSAYLVIYFPPSADGSY